MDLMRAQQEIEGEQEAFHLFRDQVFEAEGRERAGNKEAPVTTQRWWAALQAGRERA